MLTYSKRAEYALNPTGAKLLRLMDEKKTNLALSLDTIYQKELLEIADNLGPEICILKTHVDILVDYTRDFSFRIQELAEKHQFLIFEDRKFADIGNTVKHQYQEGIFRIADWAHITNAYVTPGPGIIEGLKQVGLPKGRGLLLIAELSSKDNLARGSYTKKAIEWAESNAEFVIGMVCQNKLSENPSFIHMTPGVNLQKEGDSLGQQYVTPQIVIGERKCDIIIVGRAIYEAQDPLAVAKKYRKSGWDAYQKNVF